jgi:hypothetical protein
MKLKIKIILLITFLLSNLLPINNLYAEDWIKVDSSDEEEIWVNTSHWENKKVLIQDGYYKNVQKKEWIDTSHTVSQGYWRTEEYGVWVTSSVQMPYIDRKWISTSHWERRHRDITTWVSANLTIYVGTSKYGWGVYSFASKRKDDCIISYNGNRYKAHKWVIDYRPSYGGRVYAIKYVCYAREVKVRQYYNVWISSGYWQSYIAYRNVNTSHWETRTRQVWVNTSQVIQSGYWRYYTDQEWVDTSHFEYQTIWIEDGFYSSPMHGEVTIEKNPRYIFTKWHEDGDGEECHMDLKISWIIDNAGLLDGEEEKEITRVRVYEDIVRYNDRGTDRVEIIDKNINPSEQGSIEETAHFEYSGSEESQVHIYLYAQSGECIHIYFSNPVNGFRSINLGSDGSDSDANIWLGGNCFGTIDF